MPKYDKKAVIRQMQFQALTNIVLKLLAREFSLSENAEQMAREWLNLVEIEGDVSAFEGVPPEWSDFAAQEQRDSGVRVILLARALATGEPSDPKDYQKNWRIGP